MSEKSLEQKSVTKSRSEFSCEIVLDFQKIKLLWTSHQFEFSGQVIPVLAHS